MSEWNLLAMIGAEFARRQRPGMKPYMPVRYVAPGIIERFWFCGTQAGADFRYANIENGRSLPRWEVAA